MTARMPSSESIEPAFFALRELFTGPLRGVSFPGVDAATVTGIEAQIAKVRKALEGTDLEEIKREEEALLQMSHKMAEAMYQGGAKPGAEGGKAEEPKAKKDSGVVDAEFEEAP